MLDGSSSDIGFKVLQDSEIFSVPVDTFLTYRTQFLELMNLQMLLLTKVVKHHWEVRKMLYLKSARERYEWFLQNYPGLIDCVPHSDIASFLNISPVTLSRIRHQ